MVEVISASTAEHYRQARLLIEEYVRWLGMDLEFQGYSSELENLAVMYGPPKGAMILLASEGVFVGCVGLRAHGDGCAEMKRMYIQLSHQGKGWGNLLMDAFLAQAAELGHKKVHLDTMRSLASALALYRRYGFVEIPPYCYNPAPDAVYMERKL